MNHDDWTWSCHNYSAGVGGRTHEMFLSRGKLAWRRIPRVGPIGRYKSDRKKKRGKKAHGRNRS